MTGAVTNYLLGRWATDIGGVVLSRFSKRGKPLPRERYKEDSPIYEGARDAMRLFVLLFGAPNVFIIKNDDRKGLAREAFETLANYEVFKATGFNIKNYLTTKHRTQKGRHCLRQRIDLYVEDKAEVGRYLPRSTLFLWFGSEAQEKPEHELAVLERARRGRLRFVQVADWKRVVEEVLRLYPNWQDVVLPGRPEEEKDEIAALYTRLTAAAA